MIGPMPEDDDLPISERVDLYPWLNDARYMGEKFALHQLVHWQEIDTIQPCNGPIVLHRGGMWECEECGGARYHWPRSELLELKLCREGPQPCSRGCS